MTTPTGAVKIPCEVCDRPIGPRGMTAHLAAHARAAEETAAAVAETETIIEPVVTVIDVTAEVEPVGEPVPPDPGFCPRCGHQVWTNGVPQPGEFPVYCPKNHEIATPFDALYDNAGMEFGE